MLGDPGVHPGGIGLQQGTDILGILGEIGLGGLADAEGAGDAVERQGGRAGELGDLAGGGAAHQFHLEQALAGMGVAEGRCGVALGAGLDAGDAVLIDGDVNWPVQPRDLAAAAAGDGDPDDGAKCCQHQQQQDDEGGHELSQYFHTERHGDAAGAMEGRACDDFAASSTLGCHQGETHDRSP